MSSCLATNDGLRKDLFVGTPCARRRSRPADQCQTAGRSWCPWAMCGLCCLHANDRARGELAKCDSIRNHAMATWGFPSQQHICIKHGVAMITTTHSRKNHQLTTAALRHRRLAPRGCHRSPRDPSGRRSWGRASPWAAACRSTAAAQGSWKALLPGSPEGSHPHGLAGRANARRQRRASAAAALARPG